jgi:hypothetical protein
MFAKFPPDSLPALLPPFAGGPPPPVLPVAGVSSLEQASAAQAQPKAKALVSQRAERAKDRDERGMVI